MKSWRQQAFNRCSVKGLLPSWILSFSWFALKIFKRMLLPGCRTWTMRIIINNYWAWLSKIPWCARHWQITIFCDNCFIIRSPSFWSTKYVKSPSACPGNRSAIFTQERSFNYAWAEHYLQQNTSYNTSFTKHLLVGSYLEVTWWALGQWKWRKKYIEW